MQKKRQTMDSQSAETLERSIFTSTGIDLFIVSFFILFFELAVIRWLPATIRVAAYFSNIVLVSCFLGLGAGCVYRKKKSLLPYMPFLTLGLILFSFHIGKAGISNPFQSVEYIFGGGGKYQWIWVLPIIFLLNALVFIGLGQKLAEDMNRFVPLNGYSINIFGSLVGTVTFAAFSFFNAQPVYWFVLSFILALWLIRKHKRTILFAAVVVCLIGVWFVYDYSRNFTWSPYYKILVQKASESPGIAYGLSVNDDYHQMIFNLDANDPKLSKYPALSKWRQTYDFPYSLVRVEKPCSILVLGAGTGNDVAAALRRCSCEVDAVELDPAILQLGRELHPEKPYSNPRVTAYPEDARAYLNTVKKRYDLIVFGWLDSHRLFSSLSNVRQDNFVYTVEALQKAKKALKKDGVLVLSFYVGRYWVGAKIYGMLKKVFGHEPEVYASAVGGYGPDGQMFVISSNKAHKFPAPRGGLIRLTRTYRGKELPSLPSDDWPYLYYKNRSVSWEYLSTILIIFALSTLVLFPSLRGAEIHWQEAAQFFLLGAAFLLLEVRNITNLALVYGSTWLVSSIVIAMVLLMILGANALVARKRVPKNPMFMWGGLIFSILLSFFWAQIGTISDSYVLNAALATLVVSLTFFFAGIIFADAFSRTKISGVSLGFNILGSVFGGLLEYMSILWGLGGLSLLALAIYMTAWFFYTRVCKRI
ncbi:hypothetical protein ACFLQP_02215 [Acidobacteriota bacterium]